MIGPLIITKRRAEETEASLVRLRNWQNICQELSRTQVFVSVKIWTTQSWYNTQPLAGTQRASSWTLVIWSADLQTPLTGSIFFIAVTWILISIKSIHQQMHFRLSFKIYITNHSDLLLNVTVTPSSGSLHWSPAKVIFRLRFGNNYVLICYAVVWQHVMGMVCVLCSVLSARRTQHRAQYTHHTHDILPHHRITY